MNAVLLDSERFEITIQRLCYQLLEYHEDFTNSVLIGLQPRGVYLAKALQERLKTILNKEDVPLGYLDVTFYRDDFRRRDEPLKPNESTIDFILEGKKVILVDDVLFTGRTVRAGLDALMDYGRPDKVEFLALVDRRFRRQLPVDSDYVGMHVDTRGNQYVRVEWKEVEGDNKIWMLEEE